MIMSKNVSVTLAAQEVTDKKLEMKADALEAVVTILGLNHRH